MISYPCNKTANKWPKSWGYWLWTHLAVIWFGWNCVMYQLSRNWNFRGWHESKLIKWFDWHQLTMYRTQLGATTVLAVVTIGFGGKAKPQVWLYIWHILLIFWCCDLIFGICLWHFRPNHRFYFIVGTYFWYFDVARARQINIQRLIKNYILMHFF